MFCGSEVDDVPNKELLEAFEEVEDMKRNPDKYKGYSDVNEMMKDILIPNEKTIAAIRETEDILSGKNKVKSYNSVKELFDDLEA